MRVFLWFARLVVFLLLFGLALNNLEPTRLHLLFGAQWTAPLFALILAAFSLGAVLGALAMLPAWLRARRGAARRAAAVTPPPTPAAAPAEPPAVIDGSSDAV